MRGNDVHLEASGRTQERLNIKDHATMMRKSFYLEAPAKTQDLLNAEWALRAAGYAIGSTWHAEEPGPGPTNSSDADWIAKCFDELNKCDALLIICGGKHESPVQISLLAGYALRRGLKVIWIGSSMRVTSDNRNVAQFETVEHFLSTLAVRLAA
jgi:hypothetical protein